MAKAEVSSRLPRSTTVKLGQKFFESLWWVARVEGRSPGELVEELAGMQIATRRKKHDATISRLAKSDAEQDQILASAKVQAD